MQIIGHEVNKRYFKNILKNDSLAHAYLFTGQEMIGKKTFALELYSLINGREAVNDPDFIYAGPNLSEGESKIYIEDIRKLKSFFRYKPYAGPYKLAVIDDAHRLTPESANALLKILEEPPGFSVLILITSLSKLVPATILSRCEKVSFNPADEKDLNTWLSGKKIKQDDKEFLIKLAGGRIGFMNRLLEKDGITRARKSIDDLRKLLSSGTFERMAYAKKVHEKEDYQPMIDHWLSWVSVHVRSSPKNEKIVRDLLSLNQIVSQPQYNHRLALENFLINL